MCDTSMIRELSFAGIISGSDDLIGTEPAFFPSCRSKFFSLLCMMEQIDVVLKWYREMPPSVSVSYCKQAFKL